MPHRLRRRLASLSVGLAGLVAGTSAHAQATAGSAPPFGAQSGRAGDATQPATPAPAMVPPRLVQFVEATYPAEARAAGLEANVVLALSIDAQGHVTDAAVTEGAGHGFDEAALAAARGFLFAPARRGETPTPARIRYRYRFTLRVTAPAESAPRGPAAVLRGVVRDAQNRPVAGATVTLELAGDPTARQTTDAAGAFRFELAHTGAAIVAVESAGYRPYRASERVADRDDVQVVYRLQPPAGAAVPRPAASNSDEQGVTVRANRPAREASRTTLERREITRIPGTGGDALRAIQNLPGLSRGAFLSGALIVRGSSQFDTQVFADGMVLPLLYHFGGLSSVIQTEMLERIDFYPGNFSARFGRAQGGVVDVGLRSPRRQGYHGVVNLNAIDASFFVEGAITPELSFAVAGRRSYVDVILNAVLSNVAGVSITAAPVYYDYQGILEWRPNSRDRVRLALLGDDDTLSVLFRQPNDNAPSFAGSVNFATRFHLAQLLWTHDFGPGTQARAMLAAGWTNLELNASDALTLGLQTIPVYGRYELSHQISPAARINAGVDVIVGRSLVRLDGLRIGASSNPSELTSSQRIATNIDAPLYQPAAYLEGELTPIPGLRLIPGLRVDFDGNTHQAVLAPRASFRWEFRRDWAVRGGAGVYAQQPQFQQSTGAPNQYFPGQTLGNPGLAYQRAMHYGLGFEHNFSPYVSLTVDGFYKTLDNLVVATPTSALLQNPPAPPFLNTGTGTIYGAEVLLRHRASSRFFGWVAYTLLHSERRDGPGLPSYPFNQDQTHILTVLGSYNLGMGWEVGLRFRYVTGSPTTPVVGSYYDTAGGQYAPINGPRNSARLGDFNQLDLRVDKTWRFRWGNVGVFLEVLNVYNRTNPEGVQFNYNYTQSQPIGGLPIFPNLGVRGEI